MRTSHAATVRRLTKLWGPDPPSALEHFFPYLPEHSLPLKPLRIRACAPKIAGRIAEHDRATKFTRNAMLGIGTLKDAKHCIMHSQHSHRAARGKDGSDIGSKTEIGKAVLNFLRDRRHGREEHVFSDRTFTDALCATIVREGNEDLSWDWVTREAIGANYVRFDVPASLRKGRTVLLKWNRPILAGIVTVHIDSSSQQSVQGINRALQSFKKALDLDYSDHRLSSRLCRRHG